MLLSLAELVTLTGYKRRGCMIRWLRANGFIFRIGADGYPRVLEDHVRLQLAGIASRPRNTPNLDALKHPQGGNHGTPQKNTP